MKLAKMLHVLIDAAQLHPNQTGELHDLADEVAKELEQKILSVTLPQTAAAPGSVADGAPGA